MRAFFDPDMFPWTRTFTDHYDAIRAEVAPVCEGRRMPLLYARYAEKIDRAAAVPSWFALSPVFFTIRNPSVLSRLPTVARLLAQVPNLVTATVLRLDGGTHLKPHGGYTPDVLRCHFGIVVPEPDACVLRVEEEQRHWREREWLVFDDYLEHEVWHRGTRPRIVLLIDVVRDETGLTPRQVAERFFSGQPGMRFDEDLHRLAPPARWLTWLETGEFSLAARS